MRHALAGSTLFLFVGFATVEAQPPTPTRTPSSVRRSPTAPAKGVSPGEAAQPGTGSTAGRPGDGNPPVRSDSTAAPPPGDTTASQILSDVSAQYDAIERAIEQSYQKLISETKSDLEDLNAKIAAMNEQVRQLRELQEKLKKSAAAIQSFNEQQAAANLSKKIDGLEAKAQRIKASLVMRTPVPRTRTPKG